MLTCAHVCVCLYVCIVNFIGLSVCTVSSAQNIAEMVPSLAGCTALPRPIGRWMQNSARQRPSLLMRGLARKSEAVESPGASVLGAR